MSLLQNAKYVVTDSGGFQRETYWAQKRALLVMPQGWQEITDTGWHLLETDPQNMDWIEKQRRWNQAWIIRAKYSAMVLRRQK